MTTSAATKGTGFSRWEAVAFVIAFGAVLALGNLSYERELRQGTTAMPE